MKTVSYDVVVVGGGPAGTAAATAAAKNGAKTLLIEQYGFLGGTPVHSLVPVFCPYSDGKRAIIRGIGLEVLERMKSEMYGDVEPEVEDEMLRIDWVSIDPEVLKRVLDAMVTESGAEIWLHTTVVDAECTDGQIHAITTYHKGCKKRIEADVFIDATGDANLVALAGGACEVGDSFGQVQGMTLCCRLAGICGEEYLTYCKESHDNGNLPLAVKRATENNDFPFPETQVATFALQNMQMAGVNFGHAFGINPLDESDLTKAEMELRKKLPDVLHFFRTYVPGAENCVIAASGPSIGIRETRRIIGEYTLTREDYNARREFADAVVRYAYPIDVHAASEEAERDYISTAYEKGESYTIPYRALLPADMKNVVVAGRALSSDRSVNGSARVAPACFAMGQAAGTAAAISVCEKSALKEINIELLRTLLTEQGAYL